MKIQIRLIQKKDNKALAKVIRTVLEEQGNDVDGTVYTDKATDKMFDAYQVIGTRYYVVLIDDLLVEL